MFSHKFYDACRLPCRVQVALHSRHDTERYLKEGSAAKAAHWERSLDIQIFRIWPGGKMDEIPESKGGCLLTKRRGHIQYMVSILPEAGAGALEPGMVTSTKDYSVSYGVISSSATLAVRNPNILRQRKAWMPEENELRT